MNKIIGIYKITSPTGCVYIGQSWNIGKRLTKHKMSIYKIRNKLYSSMIKYGWDAHKIEILQKFDKNVTQDILDYYEIKYMDLYKNDCELLNIKQGGSRGKNTIETILKMSKSKQTFKPFLGKHHTDETKILISKAQKGNQTWLGKTHTTETKLKIAEIRKNLSNEARVNLSNSLKGRVISKETRLKMSLAKKEYHKNKNTNKL